MFELTSLKFSLFQDPNPLILTALAALNYSFCLVPMRLLNARRFSLFTLPSELMLQISKCLKVKKIRNYCPVMDCMGFPGDSVVKKLPAKHGDLGSIPGSGSSPGEENGNPLQYSCLGNTMDRGAWRTTVHGVTRSWTGLSD